jgi:Phage integrase family
VEAGRSLPIDDRDPRSCVRDRRGGEHRHAEDPAWPPDDRSRPTDPCGAQASPDDAAGGTASRRAPTDGRVFTNEFGQPLRPSSVGQAFQRLVATCDVPRIRLHDLRDTHASRLLAAGVNPRVVSERLGHSSVSFTLDTYGHVMPGQQAERLRPPRHCSPHALPRSTELHPWPVRRPGRRS